ncbi:CoA transferase [Streptomyces sp. NPDC093252]|uniref:CoA transferase n=1 Tax=Streptomyces sp. NPDC093252 TaxID=3154980 RepID=UPI00344A1476
MSRTSLQPSTAPPHRAASPLPLYGYALHLPASPPPGLASTLAVVRDHITRFGGETVTTSVGAEPSVDTDSDSVWLRLSAPHVSRETSLGHRVSRETSPGRHVSRETSNSDASPSHTALLHLRGWGELGSAELWGPYGETTAQAVTGLMAVQGRATGGPRRLGVDYLAAVGGVVATTTLLATALGEARGMPIDHAELGLAHTALYSLGQYLAAATTDEEPEAVPTRPYSPGEQPPFVSADGIRFEVEALDSAPWQAFWRQLGVPARQIAESWGPYMGRYSRATAPVDPALAEAAVRHTYSDVQRTAEITGMSVSPVRALHHRMTDEDVVEDHAPWALAGELDVLDEFGGFGEVGGGRSGSRSEGARLPLAGLRVVESTRRIQGPLAGLLLGALGAEVIRVEPPGGDPLRGIPPMAGDTSARFLALNRGKSVHEIDFRTPRGRREVLDLVADADVFLHNWAPGKAAQLGLDHTDLAAVRPGIVYAWASGWGRDAPAARLPLGTDFMVQAWSGVADALRTEDRAPAPSLVTLLDLLGGFIAAEGVVAGLLARRRGAGGVRVDTSLLGASRVLLGSRLRGRGQVGERAGAAGDAGAGGAWPGGVGSGGARTGDAWPGGVSPGGAGPHAGGDAVPVRTDLRALPADPLFGQVFLRRGCALVMPPWRFS